MDKRCGTCKYDDLGGDIYPCSECKDDYSKFESAEAEEINHPPRYKHGEYECIDVMLDVFGTEATQAFCLLSAFKYVWRKDYKGGINDIRKAMWYLDKWLELEGAKNGESN